MSKKGKHPGKISAQPSKTKIVKRPSISVCLIVKDEERFLENCLKSIKDIAYEIIVIDTGSRDNTVNIAKKFTDKVYSHPWKDSYSEARNHYFEYSTGDWIFQIDADEELVKEDIPVLLKAVEDPVMEAVLVQIVSYLSNGKSESRHSLERIFRNNGVIHYEGRIHERLVGFKKAKIFPIHLIHYGYDLNDEALSEKKNKRRINLLKMDIDECPDNPLTYHYLSCCYLYRNLLPETIDVSLRAIDLAERQKNKNPVFLWTRYNASVAYHKLKDFKNAESMAFSSIQTDKRHLDSYFILMLINHDQSKWHDVIKYGNEYFQLAKKIKNKPEEFGTIVFNSLSDYWKALIWIGVAYYETGNKKEAERSFGMAESNASDLFSALKAIGVYYYNKAHYTRAREYLEKASKGYQEDPTVKGLLEKISSIEQKSNCRVIVKNDEYSPEKPDRPDNKDPLDLNRLLSLYINASMPDNAMDIIKNQAERISVTGSVLCKIAVLYIEKGQLESAIKCYMTALEKDTRLFEAWASLGEITLNLNRLEEAQIFFEKALEINENDMEIILGLCEVKAKTGDINSIIKYCNIILERQYLPREKTISSSEELKAILLEIAASLKKKSCSERINRIISDLSLKQGKNPPPGGGSETMFKKKPLIIALIDIPQNITTGDYYYRTFSPGIALAREKDIYVVSVSNIHPKKFDVINNADILILNNICDPDLLPIIRKRKEEGFLTVFEMSDDLNALQPWNAVYKFYQNKENIALIYKLASYCDKLQFSVYELQKLYGKLNPVNRVFPNQILDLPPERILNAENGFIIGWGGSHGHMEDIASISGPLIKWVQSKPGAKLYLMCSRPIWELFKELPENKKRYFPTGSLKEYYSFLSEIHVGIAPLQSTAFNRCRSDVKFLEYSVSGVVPLVSYLEPYRFSVKNGKTGFLFNSETDLIKVLDLLENNRQILRNVSVSAKAYVINQRMQPDHVRERMEFYRNSNLVEQPNKKQQPDPKTIFDSWCRSNGAIKNDRFLILSNTEFEKSVYSGLALMQNISDKASANDHFEKASILEPQNYLPFLYSSQTSADPIAQLTKAIKLAPHSIKAHILMGEELARQGKTADSIRVFNKALEIFPEYDVALLRIGNLFKSICKHDQAEGVFRRALDLKINQ